MTQQWSATVKEADIVLSGTPPLTATGGVNNYATGVGTEFFTTGRYYWECVITTTGTAGCGIANDGLVVASLSAGNYLGIDAGGLGYFSNAGVFSSGGQQATYATFTTGTRVCVALDLISSKIWWRPGIAANWNNDVIGSQNPDVGSQVGGLAIPAGFLAQSANIGPAYTVDTTTDTVVASFASSSWSGVAPTGFLPFDADLMGQAWM